MNEISPARPRIPRETRLLIATVVISAAALWVLSRIRFPERPIAPAPVPPILTPLVHPPAFSDLAAAVADLRAQIAPHLVAIDAGSAADAADTAPAIEGLRIADDLAVALVLAEPPAELVAGRDRATGLTVVRTPASPLVSTAAWSPNQAQQPRYLFAARTTRAGTAVRPLFVDALDPVDTPLWPAPLWALRAQADAAPGTFLFTAEGLFAGLVATIGGLTAMVPGDVVLREAERVRIAGPRPAGWIGLDVRAMTPSLAAASGEAAGVVIAWVDPLGPAAGTLMPGDLVVAIDGTPAPTLDRWKARAARLAPGDAIALQVRRAAEKLDVILAAVERAPASLPVLGLSMRAVRGIGTEIVAVARGSVAARAGLRAGDLITRFGARDAPVPGDITRAFAAAGEGAAILVALDRGEQHDIVALVKR